MIAALSVLAILVGFLAALLPLAVALVPRLTVWPLYHLTRNRLVLLTIAFALAALAFLLHPSTGQAVIVTSVLLLAALTTVLYPRNIFIALIDPPHTPATHAPLGDRATVLGFTWNGEAAAWPFEMIIPHHLVNDWLGGAPLLVGY